VAVKIRLKRLGKIRAPYYRIVVADSRTKRDGRAIEEIGKYHPTEEPSLIQVDRERAQYWLGVGAQPTEQVKALLKVTGDWQTFRGEPGGEGTLRVKEAAAPVAQDFSADRREKPKASPAQPAEVANAEQPDGTDEPAEAGSVGTSA
jgi:small subunit ribosomal protein S16